MLLVILLDWSDPWNWIRELRAWIRILNNLLGSLYNEAKLKVALDENINQWKDRKRRITSEPTGGDTNSSIDVDVTLPLGPGDWDRPLGVPLSVVCQNANRIEIWEKESGWKDRHFDFVQQFVRTILLKHGGSLIYTMPNLTESESTLQTLIHTTLGVQSMLQRKTLKHNTTDRDHIVVPPNFDSWGKIRILTDDFNIEAVSQAWERDIEAAPSEKEPYNSAVSMYHRGINNPKKDLDMPDLAEDENSGAEVESRDTQAFLGEQAEILEELTKEDERTQLKKGLRPANTNDVEEHIGPVQFNMGGIQMDAEDLVKRLKVSTEFFMSISSSLTPVMMIMATLPLRLTGSTLGPRGKPRFRS
jgi:dynein light intermediate chain 1, cytosolic